MELLPTSKAEYYHQWYLKNRPRQIAKARAYREANLPVLLQRNKEAKYKHRYGFSLAEKAARIERQGGLCAICLTDKPGGSGRWHTDHNHKTKQVRDELCHGCNTSLGHVKENLDTLRAMIVYLSRWESQIV